MNELGHEQYFRVHKPQPILLRVYEKGMNDIFGTDWVKECLDKGIYLRLSDDILAVLVLPERNEERGH